jgi:NAD-dependent deacetylase
LRRVITQNIDGLHRKAGSRNVIEIHGSLREILCVRCGKEYRAPKIPKGTPPRCACGGVLKPNTVLFGESLPRAALESAWGEAGSCRLMLVIGTSAVVQPAAALPFVARDQGAKIMEINPERAIPGADLCIQENAGSALPRILAELKELSG